MKLKIDLIEDRGINKTIHFYGIGNNTKGYISIGEMHPWFSKEVGDELTLSDQIGKEI